MAVRFEIFESSIKSWPTLFTEAAEFASQIGPERLIGISHSQESNRGVVAVWYWDVALKTGRGQEEGIYDAGLTPR